MGLQIYCRWRSNRQGYKAGAMLEGMDDIEEYDFCAIFDADFHPEADFLLKTVPYLIDNPLVGFVQARWTFANAGESLLTRMQELSLNYHVKCEQFARFSAGGFLNFNGTAGVWRRTCIIDAGNWNNRTTVEDMDLSLRAHLRGWKFLFLDHVECLNEVPATYEAYRKQQHRWSCGPMQLWRKATSTVWASNVSLCHKLYLTVFFFGTRMFATHVVSFFFYCTLVPICIFLPEVAIPMWAIVYMPILVTLSTLWFTDGGWHWALHYVLFENAMSIVKMAAMVSGLLELSNAHEWVVTTKLGNWMKGGGQQGQIKIATDTPKPKRALKIYKRELSMGLFNLLAGLYGIFVVDNMEYSLCIIFQGLMFCAFGFNLMDESVECDSCTAWAARKWRSTKVLNLSTRPTLAPDGALGS